MSKKQKATDPARFEGNGISYRAKIIGIEDVAEARGDKMCQETIQKLKGAVKVTGHHKQRVFINVTLEGLKIIDGVSLTVLHIHPVHQISFISRDVTDSRAFGYIYGPGEGLHKFFGIKTANAAENVVLALRDLFQTVYEMKKQEMEKAKAKAVEVTEGQTPVVENETEAQVQAEDQPAEGQENIYQVPKNNAPINAEEQEEAVANLLDLEDQVDTIRKGIEQIKNLEFEVLTSEESATQPASSSVTTSTNSPATTAPVPAASNDPWAVSASPASVAPAPTSPSSALSDLEQLSQPPVSSNPFGSMQAFPDTPAPSVGITVPGFGMIHSGQPFGQQGAGPPMMRDPFSDPFNTSHMQAPHLTAASGGTPFGAVPGFGAQFPATISGPTSTMPFHGPMATPAAPGMLPAFGVSPAFAPIGNMAPVAGFGMQRAPFASQPGGAGSDPFQQPQTDTLLQPFKPGGQEEQARPVSPSRATLFGELVDIKKSAGAESVTKTPKEMFQDLTQTQKKSLNEIKGDTPPQAPQASVFDQDPFIEDPFGSLDTMLNSIASCEPDPFTPSGLPASSSSPPPLSVHSLPPQPPAPPDPSPAKPDLFLSAPSSKESSPETRFDVPDEPPPPLPSHLLQNVCAPSPPPRPPPIPSRPMPKTAKASSSPVKCGVNSFVTPPPLPTTPRPSSSIAHSSSGSELSSSDTTHCSLEALKGTQSSRDASGQSSPSVPPAQTHYSPSHSWGSDHSLSHSSSQKSLERTMLADSDDPFGVPLRSKKSFSSADGSSKRSSRSSGKSIKSDSKLPLTVDPFGVPLKDQSISSGGSDGSWYVASADNPFSVSDSLSVGKSQSAWEAFGDHPGNGATGTEQLGALTSNSQKPPTQS